MGIMSVISALGGLIRPATDLTRVVRGDKHAARQMDHDWSLAVLAQLGAEFAQEREGWFDHTVNGLNRLPRPALALGTIGLFVYAMADPVGFASRMQGLALVPDQLWWLLGAIVSFYFGARELHYFRSKRPSVDVREVEAVTRAQEALTDLRPETGSPDLAAAGLLGGSKVRGKSPSVDPNHNAALEDWMSAKAQGGAS